MQVTVKYVPHMLFTSVSMTCTQVALYICGSFDQCCQKTIDFVIELDLKSHATLRPNHLLSEDG